MKKLTPEMLAIMNSPYVRELKYKKGVETLNKMIAELKKISEENKGNPEKQAKINGEIQKMELILSQGAKGKNESKK